MILHIDYADEVMITIIIVDEATDFKVTDHEVHYGVFFFFFFVFM